MTSMSRKTLSIAEAYEAAANDNSPQAAKDTSPYSIRLTQKERAYLKGKAGNRPMSAYIRDRLLGDHVERRRELRRPQMSQSQYALLLANLGASRMSANLNQLAKHANMGTLDEVGVVDIEQELRDACAAVLEMRKALLMALGLKTGD